VIRRGILPTLFVALLTGCAAPAPAPPVKPAEPSSLVWDSTVGGGRDGAAFFYVESVNGKPVAENALTASASASRGLGSNLVVRASRRYLVAGPTKLTITGRYAYAAPIQTIFHAASSYRVSGDVDVNLEDGKSYRVRGVLDAFRREVWLEEEGTAKVVTAKITALQDSNENMAAMAKATLYTCCNFHYDGNQVDDTNATTLPFIPAGSRVVVKEYGKHRAEVLIEGRPFRLDHDEGREQETREQYFAKLLSNHNPNDKISTYSKSVQAAIRAGKVLPGMTKEQAIIGLGYPRTDRTASTENSEWTYWTADDGEFVLLWNAEGRLQEVDAARKVKQQVVYQE
jgi:hypothetical protein